MIHWNVNLFTKAIRLQLLTASLLLLICQSAVAQTYAPGDRVTVIHWDVHFKMGDNILGGTELGDNFDVGRIEGNWLWVESAQGYLHRDDVVPYDQAVEHFTAMIWNNSQDNTAYHDRACVWWERGELDRAIEDFSEAIRLYPEGASASFFCRGGVWNEKREYDQAIADYTEAIRLDPTYARAYRQRGMSWELKGQLDFAIIDLTEAIRLDPNNQWSYLARAAMWDAMGEADNAIADYSEVIRLNPSSAFAYEQRAFVYGAINDFDKAIADFSEVIRLDPNNEWNYLARAAVWDLRGETENAIADFTEAIRLNPSNAIAFERRASAYRALNDFDKAIADLNEVARLVTPPSWILNELAWLYATCPDESCRDGQLAVTHATAACELSEWKDCHHLGTLAAAYAEMGDFDKAVEWQTKAVELATAEGLDDVADFQARLELYQASTPYHESMPQVEQVAAQ